MLVVEGRCVSLADQSWTAKDGKTVEQYHLTLAGDRGVMTVIVSGDVLRGLGTDGLRLQEFGTGIAAEVEPALINDFGNRKPALKAVAIEVVADVNGEPVGTGA